MSLTADRDSINRGRKQITDLPNELFTAHQFKSTKGTLLPYRLLQPAPEKTEKTYPLVVVLHGSHAVGTDNQMQMGILAKLWALPTNRLNYPAYVVAPQFPSRSSNYVKDESRNVLISAPQPSLNTIFEWIDSLVKFHPINPKKIYIIGHSMGSSGVTNVISLKPKLFAAGVAASGIPNFNNLEALAKTPLWIIHGNKDPENPIYTDRLLYQELKKRKPKDLKFTEVDGMEHEIWPGLFLTDALPKWLFSF